MAGEAPTSQEYIQHHLTNLAFGKHADGSWGFAGSPEEIREMGFWAIHVDTMIWSIGLGILFLALFTVGAKKPPRGSPVHCKTSANSPWILWKIILPRFSARDQTV